MFDGSMMLSGVSQRVIGATVIGALTACSVAMLSRLVAESSMDVYHLMFRAFVVLVGALSMITLLSYRRGSRRFLFAPSASNWWTIGVASSGLCAAFAWLLAQHSPHVLVLSHMPSVVAVLVLFMYRIEADDEHVEPVRIREVTEAEWNVMEQEH